MENFPTEEIRFVNHDLRQKDLRRPTLKQVCMLYSTSVILLMFLASRVQRWNEKPGLLITEVGLILPLPLIFLLYNRYDLKRVLRLNKISVLNLFLTFCLIVFAIPIVNILNSWYLLLVRVVFGRVEATSVAPANDWKGLLINVLIIGVSAGICEETLFRGTIMRGFERFGAYPAIVFTAFLFGLWHIYFTSFMGTFLLGILIGWVVYRTNSIFSGMFAHFTNNAASVLLAFLVDQLSKARGSGLDNAARESVDQSFSKILDQSSSQLIGYFVSQGLVLLFFAIIFTGIAIAFIRTTSGKQEIAPRERVLGQQNSLVWLLPGLAFIAFVYVALGLALMDRRVEWVIDVLRFIGL